MSIALSSTRCTPASFNQPGLSFWSLHTTALPHPARRLTVSSRSPRYHELLLPYQQSVYPQATHPSTVDLPTCDELSE